MIARVMTILLFVVIFIEANICMRVWGVANIGKRLCLRLANVKVMRRVLVGAALAPRFRRRLPVAGGDQRTGVAVP